MTEDRYGLDRVVRLLLDLEEALGEVTEPAGSTLGVMSMLDHVVGEAIADVMMWPEEHGISDETFNRWYDEDLA